FGFPKPSLIVLADVAPSLLPHRLGDPRASAPHRCRPRSILVPFPARRCAPGKSAHSRDWDGPNTRPPAGSNTSHHGHLEAPPANEGRKFGSRGEGTSFYH